jgi:steroid delta-isomerase
LPSTAVVKKVVADYFAAARNKDRDAWLHSFAEDAVTYDPVGSAPTVGHRGLLQFFDMIAGVFEELAIHEDSVFASGNGAAVKWTGKGVGKNGCAVTFEGIDVFEINDQGKIQKLWGYWNPEPLMAQLLS